MEVGLHAVFDLKPHWRTIDRALVKRAVLVGALVRWRSLDLVAIIAFVRVHLRVLILDQGELMP